MSGELKSGETLFGGVGGTLTLSKGSNSSGVRGVNVKT